MFNFDQLVKEPFPLIGVPFMDGGRDQAGFDCWGLVMELFRRWGVTLPDYKVACLDASKVNNTIVKNRTEWIACDPSALPVPCLVVIRFNHPTLCTHTGVYIGDGQFIHTRQPIGVNIDRIDSPAWKRKIDSYYIPRSMEGGTQ